MIRASRSYKPHTDISGARLWLATFELGKQGEKKDMKLRLGTPYWGEAFAVDCLGRDNMTGWREFRYSQLSLRGKAKASIVAESQPQKPIA